MDKRIDSLSENLRNTLPRDILELIIRTQNYYEQYLINYGSTYVPDPIDAIREKRERYILEELPKLLKKEVFPTENVATRSRAGFNEYG
jgi:uncharacterized protein (DUF4213/DUF364 family)